MLIDETMLFSGAGGTVLINYMNWSHRPTSTILVNKSLGTEQKLGQREGAKEAFFPYLFNSKGHVIYCK